MDNTPQVRLTVEIRNAQYHPVEKRLLLAVLLPNGELRGHPISPDAFLFHGKPATETSQETIDSEMEKLAELFRQRRGSKITLTLFEDQLPKS